MSEMKEKPVKEKLASVGGYPMIDPPAYLKVKPSKHRKIQLQSD